MKEKTSLWENSSIWLGAGISIAEIFTGTYFAPLGWKTGLEALLLGHVIGCFFLFLAGYIGARTRKNAMETIRMSFGHLGGVFFAVLNVCQLIGWTGIMIYDGAASAEEVFAAGQWFWCLVIGALLLVWLACRRKGLDKLNTAAVVLLLALTVWLSYLIFTKPVSPWPYSEGISFGAAVELGVSMPLSWLPLISDYTSKAEKPLAASAVSVISYGLVSCWMYVIGMGAALLAGEENVARVMAHSGIGLAGLLIVVFSTVTTTFLDAYSAGVSSQAVNPRINAVHFAMGTVVVGTLGALLFPLDNLSDFLYLIGSVFAPMTAVLVMDYFCFHRSVEKQSFDWGNLVIWLIGFFCYRWLMTLDLPLGSTIYAVAIVMVLCALRHVLFSHKAKTA